MMSYYFYLSPENKIVVARYAKFFEKNLITQEVSGMAIDLEEIQDEDTSPSEITSEIPMEVEGFQPPQEEVIPVRRSERTHRSPNCLCLNVKAEEHSLGDLNEPTRYKAAMLDSESNKWIDAINAKIQSMIDNMVWVLVDLPPNSRLVAKGYTQLYKVDYEETFSLVTDIRAIRIPISIAVFYDYEIWQMDVKTAFLNGYLDEDIYMVQPEGFVDPDHPRKSSGSNVTFLILYVDDIIIMRNHIPSLQSVKDYLGKCFAMKDLGEAAFILGIKIYRDRLDLNKTQGTSIPKEVKRMQNVPYASAVGSIIYFLVYGGNPEAKLRVDCYCDAGFETNKDDTKSQTGYVFILNGGAVDWKSSKQSTTAMSAIEAEYIAASEAVWIRKLFQGLSIALGEIRFLKVHTDNNLVDPFTKALPKGKLTQHSRSMGLPEVENQLNRKIKIVRSDRGGEYYGKHSDLGQSLGLFALYCQENGIVNQFTIGSGERSIDLNKKLMDVPNQELSIPLYMDNSTTITSDEVVDIPIVDAPPPDENPIPPIVQQPLRRITKWCKTVGLIDYNETFSPVSRKDSLRISMALVAHYDLELHQMDVKTAFLNGDLHEDVYMTQPEGFMVKGKEHMVCKLKRSIYRLKKASRQWYLKFHEVMSKFQFKKNAVDQCIYLKLSGSKFVILVLYVDDIILASNDLNMLYETKRFLSENFEMKDLGEASNVIGIEIYRDRSRGILGLSQRAYIDKILKKYNMQNCSPTVAPVVKGDKFDAYQCPKNNPKGKEHCTAAKKVLRYIQGTKNTMLSYRKTDNLEVIGYSDSDFAKCKDSSRSTSGYIFMLSGGPISWRSREQELTTTSTMMAEYVACYHAASHAILLRNLVSGLKEGGGQPPHGLLNRSIDNIFGSLEKLIAKMNRRCCCARFMIGGTGNIRRLAATRFHIGSYQGCTNMEFCRTEYEKAGLKYIYWRHSKRRHAIGENYEVTFLRSLNYIGAVPSWDNIVIAYEHVWAIGTDNAAPPEQAQEVHVVVRDWLAKNIHRLRQRIECYKRALILATCMGHWNR
ncbi:retrotransposon protein, putative, ty1-copia subclass [Tanacetum coccineum]|uniref:Retrotransposon protein, putative, ty1-copia subclass n=1 Tax=Tanacetum coccineum TaxID=301880 RepID=A0ABQ4YHY5_9ASTR